MGFRMSMPISMKSGIRSKTSPSVWKKTLALGALLDEGDELGVERLEHLPVHLGRDQQAALGAQVVADLDDVDQIAAFSRKLPIRVLQRSVISRSKASPSRDLRHVDQELVHALHGMGPLEGEEQPGRGHDGVLALRRSAAPGHARAPRVRGRSCPARG